MNFADASRLRVSIAEPAVLLVLNSCPTAQSQIVMMAMTTSNPDKLLWGMTSLNDGTANRRMGVFEFYALTGETRTWNYSYPAHAVFLFHVSACVLGAEIMVS